jgi:hemerythrin-like domain-containing protein
MRHPSASRRHILITTTSALTGIALLPSSLALAATKKKEEGEEVGAVEDLMREHGVLRRALLVYTEAVASMRAGTEVDAAALNKTARLFRAFGEDYHERQLEEAYILPAIRKIRSVQHCADVIAAQHQRGREITDYILKVTGKGKIGGAGDEAFPRVLDAFVRMYQNHTAREDTVVFPAWKNSLSKARLRELSEKFEEIEHKQFGKDGFDDAVKQIAQVEQALGFDDLARFTAPPPPAS